MSLPDEIAVWGDELLEHGDPLGHIIALGRAGATERARTAQREYERAHFSDRALEATWKHGVIDEIRLKAGQGRLAREILECPATRYLRLLELEVESNTPAEDPTPIFVEHGVPPSLRVLKLWARAGKPDFRSLYSRLGHVERLDLFRPDVLGIPDLPNTRWLRVVAFDKAQLSDLAKANLPVLETLSLAAVFWGELAELSLPNLPALRTLALVRPPWEPWFSQGDPENQSYGHDELRALVESPLAAQAKAIEFHGLLTPQMLGAIVVYASWLERFERVSFVPPKDVNIQNELIARLGARLSWL